MQACQVLAGEYVLTYLVRPPSSSSLWLSSSLSSSSSSSSVVLVMVVVLVVVGSDGVCAGGFGFGCGLRRPPHLTTTQHKINNKTTQAEKSQSILDLACNNGVLSPLLLAANSNRSVTVWDLAVERPALHILDAHRRPVHRLALAQVRCCRCVVAGGAGGGWADGL